MSGRSSELPLRSERFAARHPSYKGLHPASSRATVAARGSSKKTNTRCEVALRRALWAIGCRYRKNVPGLPGQPDIVFLGAKIAVFCDGDFWHGRDWETRRQKLSRGTNSDYWLAKIQGNMERDQRNTRQLQEMGWTVLRFWESQIQSDLAGVARAILEARRSRGAAPPSDLDTGRHHDVKKA